jgi:hypothetical protein
MALVGNRYVNATDPGAVGAGYQWLNTTNGNLYERNTSNTAWVSQGNVNSSLYGAAPISGFTAQGAISGATGLATLSASNFQSLQLNNVNVATVNDLADAQTAILKAVDSRINSGLAGVNSSSIYSTLFAFDEGILNDGDTVPLPTFFGDRTAFQTEIVYLGVDLWEMPSQFTGDYTFDMHVRVDPLTRVVACHMNNSNNEVYTGTVKYHIIAMRKN